MQIAIIRLTRSKLSIIVVLALCLPSVTTFNLPRMVRVMYEHVHTSLFVASLHFHMLLPITCYNAKAAKVSDDVHVQR
jgi:hypothetical protein